MMRFLVIEDEKPAADRLISMVQGILPGAALLGVTDSVKSSVRWLQSNPAPDLIFMDIQLADGLSFKIFEMIKVDAPVIFTTAFNDYAIKAFKVNSIDYLLKPIDKEEIVTALEKYNRFFNKPGEKVVYDNAVMEKIFKIFSNTYKERFVVKVGEHLRHIGIEEIAYFYSMEKETFLNTFSGKCYGLEFSLDQLEGLVNPKMFFRINRRYLVSLKSIRDILSYSGSRLKLRISEKDTDDTLVSREKVAEFKLWLEGDKS